MQNTDNAAAPVPVAVLGLGMMGRALAEAFLRDGHPTSVWNRTPGRAAPLAGQGADLAGSPAEAVAAARLVVVCVTGDDAVRALLEPLGKAIGGRVVANLSSGTPGEARALGEWAARHGAVHLDGAIMAVPGEIGTADATVVYSGPREAFDRHEPVLRSLAAGTAYLGEDHGLASLHELAGLSLMWGVLNGFLHGAAMVGAAGTDAAAFAPLAKAGIEAVARWVPDYARQIDAGEHPVLDATVDTHLATMRQVADESEALGVSAELPAFVESLAARAAAAGRGGDGYSALIEQFRKPSRR